MSGLEKLLRVSKGIREEERQRMEKLQKQILTARVIKPLAVLKSVQPLPTQTTTSKPIPFQPRPTTQIVTPPTPAIMPATVLQPEVVTPADKQFALLKEIDEALMPEVKTVVPLTITPPPTPAIMPATVLQPEVVTPLVSTVTPEVTTPKHFAITPTMMWIGGGILLLLLSTMTKKEKRR